VPLATATLNTASARRTTQVRFVAAMPLVVKMNTISQNGEAVNTKSG
jgi:hypothetical protein